MSIQTALIPHKHVRFCECVLAVAGRVRTLLNQPRTIDELWSMVEQNASAWPTPPSFTELVFALDVLFAIKQIEAVTDGRVRRVTA